MTTAEHHLAPPLWRLLQAAAGMLRQVRAGRSLSELLPAQPPELRAGAQALVFHALRWLGLAEGLRALLVQRTPPPAADALLCVALALLAQPEPAYAAHTLIDQAVEAAKREPSTRAHARLLNACLRRYTREWRALRRMVQAQGDARAAFNHPRWWVQRVKGDHPQHWLSVLQAAQRHPPMTLRVNVQRIGVEAFMAELERAALPARALGGAAVQLERPCPVRRIPGFADGWCSVQSFTAQRAAPLLLDALPPDCAAPRVLDACAAPGGKTGHVLELLPDAQVTALDVDERRLARVQENLARLGQRATLHAADAAQVADWWDGQPFDAILLDAPCSASGISARHPDVRWLRREEDIAQLVARQDALLHALWPLLRAGGALLYVTCSLFRAEGSARIKAFLASHADAQRLPAPGHVLPKMPQKHDDGEGGDDNTPDDDAFYFALLRRSAP
ncbi:MAG: 16S rRNA (cytosine(967)-C(5))-methyltransferase RsmB [Ottowia sp.]|nr:16S rRNA (cytosine(967)-C(5))-methyltransferase RsmB [Ottowia sp.]MBQ9578797.1 16S rRNA (cytosine(967)-C(5))-methyltransferase RsmB [Ottowia sp.]